MNALRKLEDILDKTTIENVHFKAKVPNESISELALPPAEEQEIDSLRKLFADHQYELILQRASEANDPSPHELLFAATAVRALHGDLHESLVYLFRALSRAHKSTHPYLRCVIYNQIAVDLYGATNDFVISKAMARESIRSAPDARFQNYASWMTLAELVLLEAASMQSDMRSAVLEVDRTMEDLLAHFPGWEENDDFRSYLTLQAQLSPYQESPEFRSRFRVFLKQ